MTYRNNMSIVAPLTDQKKRTNKNHDRLLILINGPKLHFLPFFVPYLDLTDLSQFFRAGYFGMRSDSGHDCLR